MSKTKNIAINGKIFCTPLSGLRRVTEELILKIDHQLSSHPNLAEKYNFEIIAPENASVNLYLKNISTLKTAALKKALFSKHALGTRRITIKT